jgi:hypothetical protein
MPLQVLPPGITSLAARRTPSFNAPLIGAPPTNQFDAYVATFAKAALSKDPRSTINGSDAYSLRVWMKAVLGDSWRDDVTFDDIMMKAPQILYQAACLYLQGRYWGALPDDLFESSAATSPAYNWPNVNSPLEQRVFTWKVKFVPVAPPSNLASLANGLVLPMIMPGMLIQKFDDSKQQWKVLNLGGTDRDFTLLSPGGHSVNDVVRSIMPSTTIDASGRQWAIKDWDFGEWVATNADWLTVFKILGIAVIAVAAAVSGGAALIGGAGLFAAAGAGAAAASTASQITNAINSFITACVHQDIGGALNGLANIVNVSFGVDLKDVATFQPALDQLQPYLSALALNIPFGAFASDAGGKLDQILTDVKVIGADAIALMDQTRALVNQFGADSVKLATGLLPDAFMQSVLKMGTNEVGQQADKIMADYQARAKVAIDTIANQVPQYLNGWRDQGRGYVKAFGHDGAAARASSIPWYGRSAYDAGTMIGAIEQSLAHVQVADINALTPEQKKALFVGNVTQICTNDPSCIRNAAEFLRQADLFWFQQPGGPTGTVQWWAKQYGLYAGPTSSARAIAAAAIKK